MIAMRNLCERNDEIRFRCSWDGEDCKRSQFTTERTDNGLCYIFNSNKSSVLRTAKTGITKRSNLWFVSYA